MLSKLKTTMAEAWQIAPEMIPDDATLNAFKPWDSLGHITMLLALESQYGIKLDEDSVQKLQSIPAIISVLQKESS